MPQPKVRIKDGILHRLREIHRLQSDEALARLIGCDRTTLRRVAAGGSPSAAFIAGAVVAFDLPFDALFVIDAPPGAKRLAHSA